MKTLMCQCHLTATLLTLLGAGPGELPDHMGVPWDLGYYLWESSTSFGRSTYYNYCEIRNGNCDCLTIIC